MRTCLVCLLQSVYLSLFLMFATAIQSADNASPAAPDQIFKITDFGAKGDGMSLNTRSINEAMDACSRAGGGQVLVPPGRFLSGTIHLRSHVTLFLSPGATLVGTTNLNAYQQPEIPSFMPEARWGKWHRALIIGENVEDVTISGQGTIDGNRVFDPTGEEHMRGPHTILFVNCRGFTIRDISILDAANYAIFFQASDDIEIRNVKITGGWDGVHFRGAPDRWCHNVKITQCQFYTGDDSIAGRYWDNTLISDCILNSSCNGLRLIGPATHLTVNNCLFYGPGQRPHRTGGRTNMLSGIILQPGAWDKTEGLLDDVLLANNTMEKVASPVTIWTKPGNPVGSITIAGLNATQVYRSALSIESWAAAPITNVVLKDAHIEFRGGGTIAQSKQPVKGPGVDARALPAWGIYARNVEQLSVQDVRLTLARDDLRPVVMADRVGRLVLEGFKFTQVPGIAEPFALTDTPRVERDDANKPR